MFSRSGARDLSRLDSGEGEFPPKFEFPPLKFLAKITVSLIFIIYSFLFIVCNVTE